MRGPGELESEELGALLVAAKRQESARDRSQAVLEKRAYFGLDGPRPCMCVGGELVVGKGGKRRAWIK